MKNDIEAFVSACHPKASPRDLPQAVKKTLNRSGPGPPPHSVTSSTRR
jgi:hypothetical protein